MSAALRTCPACGGKKIDWYEWATLSMHFTQDEDGIDPEGYVGTPDPIKVTGECANCGHCWTAKKVSQIWDLPGHPDYEPSHARIARE